MQDSTPISSSPPVNTPVEQTPQVPTPLQTQDSTLSHNTIPSTTPPAPPPPSPSSKRKLFPLMLIILIAFVTLAGLLFYTTRYLNTSQTAAPLEEQNNVPTLQKGILKVGTDATFPPMEYLDDNGNFVGYDIELADRIAQKLGVQVQFQNIAWDDIFTALENKEIDVIISSVTITDERKQKYNFSESYINAGQVIITRKTDTTIKTTADLNGKKIAVQKGTTNEQQALQFTQPENVLTYDDFVGATEALKNGEADAIFSDLTGAKGIIAENDELKIASEPFTSDFYGIVLRKEDTQLLNTINEALNSLRQQGSLVLLKQKWLE